MTNTVAPRPPMPEFYGTMSYIDLGFSTSHLKRWHMTRTVRDSSLSDHTIRVAYAFRFLLRSWMTDDGVRLIIKPLVTNKKGRMEDGTVVDFDRIRFIGTEMAMDHDMFEVLTGDIPAHIKDDSMRSRMKAVDEAIEHSVADHAWFFENSHDDGSIEFCVAKHLVKLADIAESYVFAVYNQGLGPLFPDAKYEWVIQAYKDSIKAFCLQVLPKSRMFPPSFCARMLRFVVDHLCGVQGQHA